MNDDLELTAEEKLEVKNFFRSKLGQKLKGKIEAELSENDSLVSTVNLTSDFANVERIGIVCALRAAELRGALNLMDELYNIGDSNVNQD